MNCLHITRRFNKCIQNFFTNQDLAEGNSTGICGSFGNCSSNNLFSLSWHVAPGNDREAQNGTSKGEMRVSNSKIKYIYMHEMKYDKIKLIGGPQHIINTSQRGCIPQALEHGVTERHPYIFSSLSLYLLLLSHSFQILFTLNHSAWTGESSWAKFVTSLLKVQWVVINSGKMQKSQGVRQKEEGRV